MTCWQIWWCCRIDENEKYNSVKICFMPGSSYIMYVRSYFFSTTLILYLNWSGYFRSSKIIFRVFHSEFKERHLFIFSHIAQQNYTFNNKYLFADILYDAKGISILFLFLFYMSQKEFPNKESFSLKKSFYFQESEP